MKNFIISLFLFICLTGSCNAQEKQFFPVEDINLELKNSKNIKIIIFIPSLTEKTEYASMIIQAFKNYFVEKLAFNPEDREKANIDLVLISSQDPTVNEKFFSNYTRTNLFDTNGMFVSNTISKNLKDKLDLPSFENLETDSVLFLLDNDNSIILRDNNYRGQGEHLKPLEYKIKTLLGIPFPQIQAKNIPLKVGDPAPSVSLNGKNISEYKGKIITLTFYPAAYSGILNPNLYLRDYSLMSCAVHITSLDRTFSALDNANNLIYFAISESTPELLQNWQNLLRTYHIKYLNDPDYSISDTFNAYNPKGYNNRITVIIDKNGKIAYIDENYELDKEAEIKKIISDLQNQP